MKSEILQEQAQRKPLCLLTVYEHRPFRRDFLCLKTVKPGEFFLKIVGIISGVKALTQNHIQ